MLAQKEVKSKNRMQIGDEEIKKVLKCWTAGLKAADVEAITGMSHATVGRIITAEKIVRLEDWEMAAKFIVGNRAGFIKYLEAAAEWYGKTLPDLKKPEEKEEQLPMEELPETKPEKKNEDIYLCKVLEALAKTNELLEQFMDVVIPKYVGDLKDNINVNSDCLSERVKKCEEKLEKISFNTRKRGA